MTAGRLTSFHQDWLEERDTQLGSSQAQTLWVRLQSCVRTGGICSTGNRRHPFSYPPRACLKAAQGHTSLQTLPIPSACTALCWRLGSSWSSWLWAGCCPHPPVPHPPPCHRPGFSSLALKTRWEGERITSRTDDSRMVHGAPRCLCPCLPMSPVTLFLLPMGFRIYTAIRAPGKASRDSEEGRSMVAKQKEWEQRVTPGDNRCISRMFWHSGRYSQIQPSP